MGASLMSDDYKVGWICATPTELAIVTDMLDEEDDPLPPNQDDDNIYTFGRISKHRVVIACLPAGRAGTSSAAVVASQMRSSFKSLRFGLLVGVGGGVPSSENDIRLGDVVVSQPENQLGGVVQYDLGRREVDGKFVRTGSLNAPPTVLLNALQKVKAYHQRRINNSTEHLSSFLSENKWGVRQPTRDMDLLFQASYKHIVGPTCEHCDRQALVARLPREKGQILVHYGTIASGNQVIRDAYTRQQLNEALGGVLCVEMEAAGLMNDFPCLVVRGICNYCDSHSNEQWQEYAAATAAAFAKELLGYIPVPEVIGIRIPVQTITAVDALNPIQRTASAGNTPLDVPEMHGASPPMSNVVPFIEAPLDLISNSFTGRESELSQVREALDNFKFSASPRFTVYGMPGVGKSQLALRFAQSAFESEPRQYEYIHWISASSEEKLKQGFAMHLELFGLPEASNLDQNARIAASRRWLETESKDTKGRWLLIFDNVDTSTIVVLRSMLPKKHHGGSILFTTRSSAVASGLSTQNGQEPAALELQPPPEAEAAELLYRRAGLSYRLKENQVAEAEELVNIVGRLPLAIDQAASFMKQAGYSIGGLLKLYKSNRLEILEWENDLSEKSEQSVAATFLSAFREIKQESQESGEIINFLCLISFLDPEGVSVKMIRDGSDSVRRSTSQLPPLFSRKSSGLVQRIRETIWRPSNVAEMDSLTIFSPTSADISDDEAVLFRQLLMMMQSPIRLQNSLQKLQNLSLIRRQTFKEEPLLGMHDLTQFLVQNKLMDDSKRQLWLKAAITVICAAFKRIADPRSPKTWPACEPFIPHIQALGKHCDQYNVKNNDMLAAQVDVADYFESRGQYQEAEGLYKFTSERCQETRGEKNLLTLRAAGGLATTYAQQGKLKEAEEGFRWVYEGYKRLYGQNHRYSLRQLENLANVISSLGRVEEAEVYCETILKGHLSRQGGGRYHPDTLRSARSLGVIYLTSGKFEDAERMFTRVLADFEKIYGSEDPENVDILTAVSDLAYYHYRQKDYKKAEVLFKRALNGNEALLSKNHPETLMVAQNLALVYDMDGRYDEAGIMCQRALAGAQVQLGLNHADTLRAGEIMAQIYTHQELPEEAVKLFQRVADGWMENLGPDNAKTLRTKEKLSNLIRTGKLDTTED